MLDAYDHVSSGEYSKELDLLAKIDRFGIKAILGREQFYYGELRKLMAAEMVVNAYRMRDVLKDDAKFVADYPQAAKILFELENDGQG